ncbi:MAG: D-2-hydroxyacid dehydrogenase [Lachnospiraceae bacterium]|nr:D-2-hydroxyacid dehydrogenase [Lachnospiraceae bacterium]
MNRMDHGDGAIGPKTRKLVVAFPALDEEKKQLITDHVGSLGFSVVFCDDQEQALKEAADAEVVFGMNAGLAKAGNSVRWACTPSAGVDHFLPVIEGTDIQLSNSSGAYGLTIAEHIVMVTLEIMRRRPEYVNLVRERIWKNDLPISSIHDAAITFVGTGDIGKQAAMRMKAFGPRSMTGVNRRGQNPDGLFDRIVTLDEIDKVLPETDLLILSLPSTKETIGLLTEERLRLLPKGAFLVNVGRGNVLDEKVLERMLRDGDLAGAALDVFEKEPLDADNTLWDCPNLVLTTHVAGNWTLPYTVNRIVEMFLADFTRYCNGEPLHNRVDLTAGY